jgi:hypothetical protein
VACIGNNQIDIAVNGTIDGTAVNILSLKNPGREWIFGSSGATGQEFYFGVTGGAAEDPDYKYYYDTGGRFAVLGNPVGAIAAPTAQFTVRGTSEFTGDVDVISTSNATTTDGTTGAIQTLGGISAVKDIRNAGIIQNANVVDSTTADGLSGALRTMGGASIAKSLRVGTDFVANGNTSLVGTLANTNTTDSTTQDGLTGAIRTLGGVSIAKDLRVGEDFVTNGNTTLGFSSANTLTCTAKAIFENGLKFAAAQTHFKIHTDTANTASGEVTFTTPLNMFTALPTATVSTIVNNTQMRVCWIKTATYAAGVATFVCRVVDTSNGTVSGVPVNIHCIGS